VIVATFSWDMTGSPANTSVTDAAGNVYTQLPNSPIIDVGSGQAQSIWVAPVTASGTGGPVANLSVSTGFRAGAAVEIDGIDGYIVDQVSTATNHGTAVGGADGAVNGTITPSVNGTTIFCAVEGNSGGTVTAGTGFAQDVTSGTGGPVLAIERLDQATAASVTGKFNTGAQVFNALTFSLKPLVNETPGRLRRFPLGV
jgi:hypothetical protein